MSNNFVCHRRCEHINTGVIKFFKNTKNNMCIRIYRFDAGIFFNFYWSVTGQPDSFRVGAQLRSVARKKGLGFRGTFLLVGGGGGGGGYDTECVR